MIPQAGQKIITIHISQEKNANRMKFGQSMEYNMKNIFLEKSYTKTW